MLAVEDIAWVPVEVTVSGAPTGARVILLVDGRRSPELTLSPVVRVKLGDLGPFAPRSHVLAAYVLGPDGRLLRTTDGRVAALQVRFTVVKNEPPAPVVR